MRARLPLLLLMVVLLPTLAALWLGARVSRDEQTLLRHSLDALWEARLDEVDRGVERYFGELTRDIDALLSDLPVDAAGLRELQTTTPRSRQLFACDARDRLLHPRPDSNQALTPPEQAFLQRTRHIWEGSEWFEAARPDTANAANAENPAGPRSGWHRWFWEGGLHFIYWSRRADGHLVGIELSKIRLLSELVGALDAAPGDGRVVLRDARGEVVHQWGEYEPELTERPRAARELSPPLAAWHLEFYTSEAAALTHVGRGYAVERGLGLAGLGLTLLLLGVYVVREYTRAAREAANKVSFVNRVSHELKTPLTNIRMYAELLRDRLDDDGCGEREVGVIIGESERLSRLIENVLALARGQRDAERLRLRPESVDGLIRAVVEQFRPGLDRLDFEVELDLNIGDDRIVDADRIEQVLANLLSNAEKYAAHGRAVAIHSSAKGDVATVTVTDQGPGVPPALRRRIFEEFVRGDESLTEDASGCGIGLALARRIARLHGGDLTVEAGPGGRGARFVFTFEAARPETAPAPPEEKP